MNAIGTSICIERSRKERLISAAKVMKISQSDLLSMLLMRSREIFDNNAITRQSVRYQRSNSPEGECFEIYHVDLYDVDYEYATSRRFIFKISVSFLFRLAIDRFLDEILENGFYSTKAALLGQRTNYYYTNFFVDNLQCSSVEFWTIPWAKREKHGKTPKTAP